MSKKLPVPTKLLNERASVPTKGSEKAAGYDVRACLDEQSIVLNPWARLAVPTGLAFAVPDGYHMEIRPRSGLALKSGITVVNAPGTLDGDYRGQLFIALVNLTGTPFVIQHGDRIAQLVYSKHEDVEHEEVGELDETERGTGGFGSTGTK